MHRLAFIVATTIAATTILGSSSLAAGVSSHDYNCNDLHNLIMSQGFVFINNPHFLDFVVANISYCPGGIYDGRIQVRSVATRDNPHDGSRMSSLSSLSAPTAQEAGNGA
jgi:hypothetical protein